MEDDLAQSDGRATLAWPNTARRPRAAVPPLRFISGDEDKVDVMGCASLVSVAGKRGRSISEWQVEDTEDPWELQRLHVWKRCEDCGEFIYCNHLKRHRFFNCKSWQPVALDSVRQGRPAEKDAVLSVAWICL